MRFGPLTLVGLAVAVAGALALLIVSFTPAGTQEGATVRLMEIFLLFMLVASSLFAGGTIKLSEHARNLAIWAVIVLSLVTLYSLRHEFGLLGSRVAGALLPSTPQMQADGTITLNRSDNGHFMAALDVMGAGKAPVAIRFLVDTGASRVALTRRDAERLGYDTDELSFTNPVSTANGMSMSANIRLNGIVLGERTVYDVPASVMDNGPGASLLGMSFLDRLSGYQVERDRLILRP